MPETPQINDKNEQETSASNNGFDWQRVLTHTPTEDEIQSAKNAMEAAHQAWIKAPKAQRIATPFWQQKWAYIGAILILSVGAWAYWRWYRNEKEIIHNPPNNQIPSPIPNPISAPIPSPIPTPVINPAINDAGVSAGVSTGAIKNIPETTVSAYLYRSFVSQGKRYSFIPFPEGITRLDAADRRVLWGNTGSQQNAQKDAQKDWFAQFLQVNQVPKSIFASKDFRIITNPAEVKFDLQGNFAAEAAPSRMLVTTKEGEELQLFLHLLGSQDSQKSVFLVAEDLSTDLSTGLSTPEQNILCITASAYLETAEGRALGHSAAELLICGQIIPAEKVNERALETSSSVFTRKMIEYIVDE